MRTNQLKRGDRVTLNNGWMATIMDNARGNVRVCEVEGVVVEIGSVYSHDIVLYHNGQERKTIEHTPEQLKLRELTMAMGF